VLGCDSKVATLGEKIREVRTALGFTQQEIAEKLDVKKQTIHKYENGTIKNIPLDKLEALASVLETSIEHLLGLNDKSIKDEMDSGQDKNESISSTKNDLSNKIKLLLKDRHLTKYRLSVDTAIPASTIQEFTEYGRYPSVPNLIKLARYFGVSVDFLLGIEQVVSKEDCGIRPQTLQGAQTDQEYLISDHDIEMLKLYCRLDSNQKQIITDLVKTLLK
jgi:transcriptional regulator with XRE-family HTH domain